MRTPLTVRLLAGAVLCGLLLTSAPTVSQAAERSPTASDALSPPSDEWTWPVEGARVLLEPFRAPEHAWSAGHRGIDVAAAIGMPVRSPAPGTVAFRGVVVDRPLLTIAHAGGLVTTLEPVDSDLEPGDAVEAGTIVGTIATGGHTASGALHLGVRWHGAYINPMLLFGGVPRAVLMPCCAPLP